ncbi:MAG: helix-turn-helix transcriptional regulator [Bacillota bacterium]|nr:helix-turn-helix transcriptional regulator [Bacillota bacterium]
MERRLLISVELLNSYKEEHGLSNSQLSKRLKVSQSTISDWLSGAKLPSGEHVEDILRFLGLAPKGEQYRDGPFSHPDFSLLKKWQLEELKRLFEGFLSDNGAKAPSDD